MLTHLTHVYVSEFDTQLRRPHEASAIVFSDRPQLCSPVWFGMNLAIAKDRARHPLFP